MASYRIEFAIQQYDEGGDDWNEVGFGSSGANGSVEAALYEVQSIVQNRQWETHHWQPDPDSLAESAP